MTKPVSIVKATYVDDYTVALEFNDGMLRSIDFGHFLRKHPHPQHNRYLDYKQFKKFHIDGGNIVWGKHHDLEFDHYELYLGKSPR